MSHSQPGVGTVASLWRYPVKSMAGERLDAVEVTDRGLVGDRAYGLVDAEDGKVATAKNPRSGRVSSSSRPCWRVEPTRAPRRTSRPSRRR